jgi:F5/8 type C domain
LKALKFTLGLLILQATAAFSAEIPVSQIVPVSADVRFDQVRNMFDGDPGGVITRWSATNAEPTPNALPHNFVIDLGARYVVNQIAVKVNWTAPKGVSLFLTDDQANWGDPIASGDLPAAVNNVKTATISGGKAGRYLKFVGLTADGGHSYFYIPEFRVSGVTPPIEPPPPPPPPTDTCAGGVSEVTKQAGETVRLCWDYALPTGFVATNPAELAIIVQSAPALEGPWTDKLVLPIDARTVTFAAEGATRHYRAVSRLGPEPYRSEGSNVVKVNLFVPPPPPPPPPPPAPPVENLRISS